MGAIQITPPPGTEAIGPGLYPLPAATYHADPAPEPSLSRGIACEMIEKTPKHGWLAHPRLGGKGRERSSRKMDVGSVVHEMLTSEGRGIHVITAKNKAGEPVFEYRTDEAKAERDAAIARGLTPVLQCDLGRAEKIAAATLRILRDTKGCGGAFDSSQGGAGELTAIWRDPLGIYGRAMFDWYGPTDVDLWDVKTTGCGKLSDRDIANRIFDGWMAEQSWWYRRGLSVLNPDLAGRLRFRFVFVEDDEPFEGRVIELTGTQEWIGQRRMTAAALMWKRGIRDGVWPGYPRVTSSVESPPYFQMQWEARETGDPLLQELGPELILANSSQAPNGATDNG